MKARGVKELTRLWGSRRVEFGCAPDSGLSDPLTSTRNLLKEGAGLAVTWSTVLVSSPATEAIREARYAQSGWQPFTEGSQCVGRALRVMSMITCCTVGIEVPS